MDHPTFYAAWSLLQDRTWEPDPEGKTTEGESYFRESYRNDATVSLIKFVDWLLVQSVNDSRLELPERSDGHLEAEADWWGEGELVRVTSVEAMESINDLIDEVSTFNLEPFIDTTSTWEPNLVLNYRTLLQYANTLQTFSGARVASGATFNGTVSRDAAAMGVMTNDVPAECKGEKRFIKAVDSDGNPDYKNIDEFMDEYRGYKTKSGLWIDDINRDELKKEFESSGGVFEIRDVSACENPLCTCKWHSVAPRGVINTNQGNALTRNAVMLRSKGSEEMVLKDRKSADDKTDSITKNNIDRVLAVQTLSDEDLETELTNGTMTTQEAVAVLSERLYQAAHNIRERWAVDENGNYILDDDGH